MTATQTSGIAAVEELDALLTKDDFEPAVEVDTVALDAAIEALDAARELVARLEALRAHLAAGGVDEETVVGLGVDVHVSVEVLEAITAWSLA